MNDFFSLSEEGGSDSENSIWIVICFLYYWANFLDLPGQPADIPIPQSF